MTKREKLAKALRHDFLLVPGGRSWSDLLASDRQPYLRAVDAVLAELREPTAAMLIAGCCAPFPPIPGEPAWPDDVQQQVAAQWQAMLDAILSEGKDQ